MDIILGESSASSQKNTSLIDSWRSQTFIRQSPTENDEMTASYTLTAW